MIDVIIQLLTTLSNLILTPIDTFIESNLPSLYNIITYIPNFLNYILNYVSWAISWLPIDMTVIYFLFDILIFRFLWVRFGYVIGLFLSWLKEVRT